MSWEFIERGSECDVAQFDKGERGLSVTFNGPGAREAAVAFLASQHPVPALDAGEDYKYIAFVDPDGKIVWLRDYSMAGLPIQFIVANTLVFAWPQPERPAEGLPAE